MKINYDTVEEIGATHYHNRTGEMYKVDIGALLVFRRDSWVHSGLPLGEAVSKVKQIPPKLTRTEYEKVTESIFDLRDEFERGELVLKVGENVVNLESEKHFVTQYSFGYIHRKIEKEIDWRDEVHEYLGGTELHWSAPISEVINDESDYFLELCRVTLRANGEIE